MDLLRAGVDTGVIALWLGHESTEATQIYDTYRARCLSRTDRRDKSGD
jgi:site-specific recombinase XerD